MCCFFRISFSLSVLFRDSPSQPWMGRGRPTLIILKRPENEAAVVLGMSECLWPEKDPSYKHFRWSKCRIKKMSQSYKIHDKKRAGWGRGREGGIKDTLRGSVLQV